MLHSKAQIQKMSSESCRMAGKRKKWNTMERFQEDELLEGKTNKQQWDTNVYDCARGAAERVKAMKEKFNEVVYDKSFVDEHQIVIILFSRRCAAIIDVVYGI